MTRREQRRAWRDYDRKQAAAEARWLKPITVALQSQIRAFNAFMIDQGEQSALSQIDVIVKPDAIEAVLASLCRKEGLRYANTQYAALDAKYGAEKAKEKAFGLNERWLRRIRDYVNEFVGNKVAQITNTTKQHIRQSVEEGISQGSSRHEIAQNMITDGVSAKRASVISRTETNGIMNAANDAAITAFGILMKDTWVTAHDERVRALHQVMEGETVIHGEPFSNGLMYPGDPAGPAEQVIRCRCTKVQEPIRDSAGRLVKIPVRE